ncbi:hypothetical protein GCM10027059_30790 [Myceligenerans halotolerans]
MTLLRTISAELRKTVSLPAAYAAVAVTLLGSLGVSLLNASFVRRSIESGRTETVASTAAVDAVLAAAPLGTVGAVILGVVVISSEYTANSTDAGGGRQLTTTLTATPHRLTVFTAKVVAVVLLVLASAVAAIPASLAVAHRVIGDPGVASDGLADVVGRSAGAALYWMLTALIALGVTVLTRNGIIPLVVLIANSSLVSVSLLLTRLTSLAYWLPDIAGSRMFARDPGGLLDDAPDPVPGGLAMAAWAVAWLAVAAVTFARHDA